MPSIQIHKDYSPEEFSYEEITKAWQAINGENSSGRCFFIARLKNPLPQGEWMSYMRWPNKKDLKYYDRPFGYEGFPKESEAEIAIWENITELGWRVRKMNHEMLPTKIDESLITFL